MFTEYFLTFIPEIRVLSRSQRQFVYEHCVHFLLVNARLKDIKGILILAGTGVAYLLGLFDEWYTSLVYMLAFHFALELIDAVVIAQNQQAIVRFVRDRACEIENLNLPVAS